MELKNIAKNTVILASPKIFSFFLKIVRAKINALLIGTTGVGIVSQLSILVQKFSEISFRQIFSHV